MPVTIPIPSFEATGVLPPVIGSPTQPGAQAPYRVSLVEVVTRFSGSEERRAILRGYLGYRSAIHGAGVTQGFQWLDGSFSEQIELLEGRPPKDLDVVSFIHHQPNPQAPNAAMLFQAGFTKTTYRCDAYAVNLGAGQERVMRQATYWYALFSHRRDRRWKGLLEVDMSPAEDVAASAALQLEELLS